MLNGYKFIGVLNLFNLYPDFLFPIYQKGEEFFFHNGKRNRIYNFDRITESVREKIVFLDSEDVFITNTSKNQYFFEHDTPVYAFQNSEKEIFCADLGDMIKYLSMFATNDKILSKQINRFVSENILEYYIYVLCSTFSQNTFFYHRPLLSVDEERDLFSIPDSLELSSSKINFNILNNLLMISGDEEREKESYKLVPGERSYLRKYGIQGDLWVNLQQRISSLSRYDRIYGISHEMYHMDYCSCRLQNIYTIAADYAKLKRDFHNVIKRTHHNSPYYDVCIKCQNAVVDMDENELIILINKNRQLFNVLQEAGLLGSYLDDYIQSHVYKFSFEWS